MKTELAQHGARVRAVDYAKSFAIFFVLLIHASSDVLRYGWIGSFGWLSGLAWGCIARGAVPLFLLCSGALLLDEARPLTVRHLWRRSIPHLLIALFFWAAVYRALQLFADGWPSADAWRAAADDLLHGRHEGHLYYLAIMLLVYAALPVTRCFAAHAGRNTLRYALLFWSVTGVLLPTARRFGAMDTFGEILQQWPLPLAWSAIGCTVLGHALRRRPLTAQAGAALFCGGFLLCCGGTWLLSLHAGTLKTALLEGLSPGPCMMAAGLFSLCCRAAERPRPRLDRAAEHLSRASFCIYLSHIAVLRGLLRAGVTASRFAPLVSVPAVALLCGAGSMLLYCVLSSIPGVRR